MTQQDKELLLEDLCARLLYGVNGLAYIVGEPCNTNTNIVGIINKSIVTNYEPPMPSLIDLDSKYITIKPYLRPMSSMTEEEREDFYQNVLDMDIEDVRYENDGKLPLPYNQKDKFIWFENIYLDNTFAVIDWLNAHHFDYRGLIDKGLAIEVTKENNPYKK